MTQGAALETPYGQLMQQAFPGREIRFDEKMAPGAMQAAPDKSYVFRDAHEAMLMAHRLLRFCSDTERAG